MLTLGALALFMIFALDFSGNWSELPQGSDPACSTWLDYTGKDFKPSYGEKIDLILPTLRTKCNYAVPFNPFW